MVHTQGRLSAAATISAEMLNYQSGISFTCLQQDILNQEFVCRSAMGRQITTLTLLQGIRPAYVPALSLHVAASAQYAPTSADAWHCWNHGHTGCSTHILIHPHSEKKAQDVLFFRFRLPGAPGFIRILEMLSAEVSSWLSPVSACMKTPRRCEL